MCMHSSARGSQWNTQLWVVQPGWELNSALLAEQHRLFNTNAFLQPHQWVLLKTVLLFFCFSFLGVDLLWFEGRPTLTEKDSYKINLWKLLQRKSREGLLTYTLLPPPHPAPSSLANMALPKSCTMWFFLMDSSAFPGSYSALPSFPVTGRALQRLHQPRLLLIPVSDAILFLQ